jgi:hypothetical protein
VNIPSFLDEVEIARYRAMATRALEVEADLWKLAGIHAGLADVPDIRVPSLETFCETSQSALGGILKRAT